LWLYKRLWKRSWLRMVRNQEGTCKRTLELPEPNMD
jgi:hypothetical protein